MKVYQLIFGAVTVLASLYSSADFTQLYDDFNELERRAAMATQETYNYLIENEGCVDERGTVVDLPGDQIPSDDLPSREQPTRPIGSVNDDLTPGECTGGKLVLFNNIRSLVHTANALTNDEQGNRFGPTDLSLGLDVDELGAALQWTAAEEYAARGSMASEFFSGQLSSLSARLNALRLGASGFSVTGYYAPQRFEFARWQLGGANNNDEVLANSEPQGNYSRLGGFINLVYGFGEKDPTILENAFNIDGTQLTAGLDYKLSDAWTLGSLLGVIEQQVDFDSHQSVVDGDISASGINFMPFVMYHNGNFFLSASLAYQKTRFDSKRHIRFPSNNPMVPATDTIVVSESDAKQWSYFFETGYSFAHKQWRIEPYLSLDSNSMTVDEFTEKDVTDAAYNLTVAEQGIDSLEMKVGGQFNYTFTPTSGVYIPFMSVEYVRQFEDELGNIESYYANSGSSEVVFSIPTDEVDAHYSVFTLGLSAVLKGGRERVAGGPVVGGVQGFINYKRVMGLENFDLSIVAAGLRYEF